MASHVLCGGTVAVRGWEVALVTRSRVPLCQGWAGGITEAARALAARRPIGTVPSSVPALLRLGLAPAAGAGFGQGHVVFAGRRLPAGWGDALGVRVPWVLYGCPGCAGCPGLSMGALNVLSAPGCLWVP